MKTPVNKKGFAQICILVPDIEAAARKWAAILGTDVPEIKQMHFEGGQDYSYRGKPVDCYLLMAVIPMEGFVIELQQMTGGDSTFHEYIRKHGMGVHHIGFEVDDTRDDVIASLAEEGFDTNRTHGVYPGSSWTIVDTEDELGVNLNIKPVR